jgi:hypothetical protein
MCPEGNIYWAPAYYSPASAASLLTISRPFWEQDSGASPEKI